MKTKSSFLTALTLALALAVSVPAHPEPSAADALPEASESNRALYRDGHSALERSDWNGALGKFESLERSLRDGKQPGRDAALYWQAYALDRAGRDGDARSRAQKLLRDHPDSDWADDARAFAADAGGSADAGNDEDKLMALDALLASGNDKAVPILEKVLAGTHSDEVKSRALFVLAQIEPARADAALRRILAGSSSKLKREAVQMIAAAGRGKALDALAELYETEKDDSVRRAILEGFLVGNRRDLLLDVAKRENEPEMQRHAIQMLGALGATTEVATMLPTLRDPATQRAAVEALAIGRDVETLVKLARTGTNLDIRTSAIRGIAIANRKESGALLAELYRGNPPNEIRHAVLEGLLISNDGARLTELYRAESDPRWKREILQILTATGSDTALELIDDALNR